MEVAFFSNYLNDHQLPLCEAIMHTVGNDSFHFVANTEMDPDRIQMGWENMNQTRNFVIRAYESDEAFSFAKKLAIESDVAIFGSASSLFQHLRLAENKLSFRYNERIFKKGLIQILDPRVVFEYYNIFTRYRRKELYVLCASAYTKRDLYLLGFPSRKCFKWGYFPKMKYNPHYDHLAEKKKGVKYQGVSILWAGRLIEWKHPEVAVSVAKHLHDCGKRFTMTIIGDGPLRIELEKSISSYGLTDYVHMLGFQSHDTVLEEMEKADIFLFTSDRNEGWGAVLNEAMNSGCAIVADKSIGSVPFLLKDNENGLTYTTGCLNEVLSSVERLVTDDKFRRSVAYAAWRTINYDWSIDNATAQLFDLIDCLVNKRLPSVISGPCSIA